MLFQMRYGSLLSSRRLQSTIQKCRGHLVEASPTPKATKWPKVWCGLKCIKSDILKENVAQYLNLGHLETAKPIFKKIGWFRLEKSKLEKGWFGSKQDNSTLRVGKKHGVAEPFRLSLGHFLELSRLSYLIWKGDIWAICWSKNFEFFQPNRYFLNILLSGSGVYYRSSRFWSVTQSLHVADQATIPHMKGDIHSYHMRHGSMISSKRLQRYGTIMRPGGSALVN